MSEAILPFLGYLILQLFVMIAGMNLIRDTEIGWTSLLKSWIFGQMLLFAVFQIVAFPMILLRWRFNALFWSFLSISLILFCFGIRKVRRIRIQQSKLSAVALFLLMASILLVLFQAFTYFFGIHLDEDDARWLAEANDALEYGNLMTRNHSTGEYLGYFTEIRDVTSPWSLLFATLSRILFTRVSIVAHTIFPTVEIIFTYGIYYLIGVELLEKKETRFLFLFLVALSITMFGGTAYTQGAFSLIRIWQGKASVAAVVIPLLLYLFICINKRNEVSDWIKVILVGLAACLMSGMGISISLIMIGGYGIYNILAYQNWRKIPLLLLTVLPSAACILTHYFLKG